MGRRLLLACETIKDEVELVKKNLSIEIETIWMSNTLHTYPEKLRDALQEEIDKVEGKDVNELLFAYGNCGNGLVGLKSKTATMIIPKYGDCIDIFLNKHKNLERVRTNTYFLTRGWLDGKHGLEWEIAYNLERFGEKRAKKITEMLYKHYNNLMLIDTGAYDAESLLPRIDKIGEILNMEPFVYKGDISPIEKLLLGQWDENFCIIEPGKRTTHCDFDGSNLRLPC